MRCLITIFFFISCTVGAAQLAPDFTVADFEGEEIKLYEDLLDEGKTVVIEFFFLDCVPCIDLSPNLELFYQDWGGGNDQVEMLSISHEDTDIDIAEYATSNGLTFPMIGIDGGGAEVFAEYSSGVYGEFMGHPTFIIIAPDGTMAFNPIEDDIEMLVSVNSVLEEVVDAGTVGMIEGDLLEFEILALAEGGISVNTTEAGRLSFFSFGGNRLYSQEIQEGKTHILRDFPELVIVSFSTDKQVASQIVFLPQNK
jgi:thiol-disulfide isomerase/thioredoxin